MLKYTLIERNFKAFLSYQAVPQKASADRCGPRNTVNNM